MAFRSLPVDHDDVRDEHGPDSSPRPGVVPGTTVELRLDDSATYPGTSRAVWVHVPAGHDSAAPAGVVFFNDGWWTLDPEGEVRGAVVRDLPGRRGAAAGHRAVGRHRRPHAPGGVRRRQRG